MDFVILRRRAEAREWMSGMERRMRSLNRVGRVNVEKEEELEGWELSGWIAWSAT